MDAGMEKGVALNKCNVCLSLLLVCEVTVPDPTDIFSS